MDNKGDFRLSFALQGWRAVADCLASEEDWLEWVLQGSTFRPEKNYRPALSFLPALQRRRLNETARLVFDAAWPLSDEGEYLPTVFVSRDGEINRSFALWSELLTEHSMSPTSFGLSVHNAPVGQWSLMRSDMSENTALCVSADGFETAFVEAFSLLCDGADKVLVLVADNPLNAKYEIPRVLRAPFTYAFAAVVTPGNEWTLHREVLDVPECVSSSDHADLPYWGALDWVRAMMLMEAAAPNCIVRNSGCVRWTWAHGKKAGT